MTNRIPPLHPASPPPFHPASPPPLSKSNFYEYDTDENDDFGDYSIADSDFTEKSHRGSRMSNESIEVEVSENEIIAKLDDPNSCSIDASEDILKELSTEKVCTGVIENGDRNEKSTHDEIPSFPNEVLQEPNLNIIPSTFTNDLDSSCETNSIITEDNKLTNNDDENSISILNCNNNDNNLENEADFEIISNVVDKDEDIVENITTEMSEELKEPILLEPVMNKLDENHDVFDDPPTENLDSVVESSEDSSAIINEAAFIVVDNKSDSEEDIPDDSFQEFSNFKIGITHENINSDLSNLNLNSPTQMNANDIQSSHTERTTSFEDDLFFSAAFEESGKECSIVDNKINLDFQPSFSDEEGKVAEQAHWDTVTIDSIQTSTTSQLETLNAVPEQSAHAFIEDDDFDDFVSPPTQNAESIEQLPCNYNKRSVSSIDEQIELPSITSNTKLDKIELVENWSDIFQFKGNDQVEVNLNTIEGKLNGSSVWCKIKNIETSPALNYNWNESKTKKILLTTLCVDSRNILFGPRWNSEVPRFASNLGFSPLVPQKASNEGEAEVQNSFPIVDEEPITESATNETNLQPSSSVRDAHFDWNDSGLTNPLDTRKCNKNAKVPSAISELEEKPSPSHDHSTKHGLSAEAEKILSNLPNLIVIEKQYIVFPIR